MIQKPKISIITIVYNRKNDIRYTLESVVNQDYLETEYIVIDGGSKDGSLDIIQEYADQIDVLVSERDEGIYDAMNKGLSKATGDYVCFINGGDELFDTKILSALFDSESFQWQDLVFGECQVIDEQRKNTGFLSEKFGRSLPSKINRYTFKYGSNISHQSFIVKKSIAPLYNTKYKRIADLNWMMQCMDKSKTFYKVDRPISKFLQGGISTTQLRPALKERFRLFVDQFGMVRAIWYHLVILFKKW